VDASGGHRRANRHIDDDEDMHNRRRRLLQLTTYPMQTYFIPLKEADLFDSAFKIISGSLCVAPVTSIISVAVSGDDTVIWYDHWEDGYDNGFLPLSPTTEVWGDHLASNGCAPTVSPCSDISDVIRAGDSFVIQSIVPVTPRGTAVVKDAGDRIQASLPVTVNRGAYPDKPGSKMAGAVDMIDIQGWGRLFEAPVGQNVGTTLPSLTPASTPTVQWGTAANGSYPFEYTAMYYMAGYDNTVVTLPDGTTKTLNKGESSFVRVDQGAKLSATKNIQVHLVTGDIGSIYEVRWFSLLAKDKCTWASWFCYLGFRILSLSES
jgi:hypothetical protein